MMNKLAVLLVSILFALSAGLSLSACKGEKGSEDKPGAAKPEGGDKKGGGDLDPGQEFAMESATENLEEVKKLVASGETDLDIKCASVTGYTDQLKDVAAAKDLVAEADKICGYEVPLKAAEAEVTKTEEARKAKPDEKVLSECFNANYDMAMKALKEKHADDPKLKALEDRFAAACPKSE
jgi:hypothetical protein